ncbi:hypothetical protein DT23_11120 [Thioclava indica]|uniref:Uncharacterized protein n=1 Tax=Thioclava indica TaxID=1353528 RepID=A0A074JZF0_9RHOB|nr:hypothetical protein DT23_11120 [Thioclava indica]
MVSRRAHKSRPLQTVAAFNGTTPETRREKALDLPKIAPVPAPFARNKGHSGKR